MKSLIFIFLLPALSYASWIQEHCSTADQSSYYAEGHGESAFYTTHVDWSHGKKIVKRIDLDRYKVRRKEITNKMVFTKVEDSCKPGDKTGSISGVDINYVRYEWTKKDGSQFKAGIIGLSRDRKTIVVDMICKTEMDNERICDE